MKQSPHLIDLGQSEIKVAQQTLCTIQMGVMAGWLVDL